MQLSKWSWLQGKTAQKYLLSYILISIVPALLISILFSYNSYLSLLRGEESQAQSRLEQLKNELDGNITAMASNAGHFASLAASLTAEQPLEEQLAVSRQLAVYRDNFPFPGEIVYYPRYGAHLYSREGYTDYRSFQASQAFGEELEMVQFYTRLNSISTPVLFTSRKVLDDNPGDYLVYMSPVPLLDPEPVGTMAFVMDKAAFNGLATNYCGDYAGYFFMFNSFYDVSYGLDRYEQYDLESVSRSLSALKGTGVIHHRIQGERFVTIRAVSATHGFTYVLSIPLREFTKPVWRQIRLFVWLVAVLLLLLLVLSLYIGVKNFRPIRTLADELLHWEPDLGGTDLFELLHSRYKTMETEVDDLQMQVESSSSFHRHKTLEDLLQGRCSDAVQLRHAMTHSGLSFSHSRYFAAAVHLERSPEGTGQTLPSTEELDAISLESATAYFVETDSPNVLSLLINTDREDGNVRGEVAKRLYEHLREAGLERVTIGVGSICGDLLRLDMSYYEALAAAQEAGESIALYVPRQPQSGDCLCPSAQGAMLRQSLVGGNAEVASQVLYSMAEEVHQTYPSFQMSRSFCFFVVNNMIQATGIMGLAFDPEPLIRGANRSELDAFVQAAQQTAGEICSAALRLRSTNERRRTEELMDYCRLHFGDYDISTEQVARRFGMSEGYVRRIIKEQVGTGLTAYITKLRFAHIKQQLFQTDIPVRELISQVGYTDVSSFTRRFKAAEGVTPGQYRTLSRQNGSWESNVLGANGSAD